MFRRLLPPITVGALLLLVGAPNDLSSRDLPLVQACTAAGVKFPPPEARLEVRKAERRMRLWSEKTLVKTYPVALGFAPVGDKERQGDGRTPEGRFFLCYRNGTSRFHRFIGISYPGPEDADRGLRERLITRRSAAAIRSSHQRKRQPPWDTRLGGAVGLHGGGVERDWTWGCVALADEAIEELFQALPLGTVVEVRP